MSPEQPPADLSETPLEVTVHGPAVVLLGPGPIALAMTIQAAERSIGQLCRAVAEARRFSTDEPDAPKN